MSQKKLVIIGGMGEGLGAALAVYFSSKDYQVPGLSRSANKKLSDIAEAYWSLTQQARSAWTHEFDLRPCSERF